MPALKLALAFNACTEYQYTELPDPANDDSGFENPFDEPGDLGMSGNSLQRLCPSLAVDMCALDREGATTEEYCATGAEIWDTTRADFAEQALKNDLSVTDLADGKVDLTAALRYKEYEDPDTGLVTYSAYLALALGDRVEDMAEVAKEANDWLLYEPEYNVILCTASHTPDGTSTWDEERVIWDTEQYGTDSFRFSETLHAVDNSGSIVREDFNLSGTPGCDPGNDGIDIIPVYTVGIFGASYYSPDADADCVEELKTDYPGRFTSLEEVSLTPLFTTGKTAVDNLIWFGKDNYPGDPTEDKEWVVFQTELEI